MLVEGIKEKITRENVNNPRTRRKFLIMWIKSRKYFVKFIVHINNKIFDFKLLIWDKNIQGEIIKISTE